MFQMEGEDVNLTELYDPDDPVVNILFFLGQPSRVVVNYFIARYSQMQQKKLDPET